jgi:hypothetical protein
MATPRAHHTATLLEDGRVLVVGGWSPDVLATAEVYSPATNTWSSAGTMSVARYDHTAIRLPNGKVLVAGGNGGTTSAELYDPATNSWSPTGSMITGKSGAQAVLLKNGRVLIAPSNPELYTPSAGTWSPTGLMPVAYRVSASVSLLDDGRALVAGGQTDQAISDVQIYDPLGNAWSTESPLLSVRYLHTATTLADGRVLVAGGFKGSGLISTAELFTPGSVDVTPPIISAVTASPASLWPPDGKLVPVTFTVAAVDGVDPHPVSAIVSIASNADPRARTPVSTVTGSLTALLRAERNSAGGEREYVVVIRCTDASGNAADRSVSVKVRSK